MRTHARADDVDVDVDIIKSRSSSKSVLHCADMFIDPCGVDVHEGVE
jgi:hypothetical protein